MNPKTGKSSKSDGAWSGSLQERLERARQLVALRDAQQAPTPVTGRTATRMLTGWDRHPAMLRIAEIRGLLERLGLPRPYGQPHDSVNTNTIRINGRELSNFSGYNYLGLSGHPEVSAAAKEAIDHYGTSPSASRMASAETLLHGGLERDLADMLGTEACVVFVSGYGTNVSTIGHLFGPDDLIVHDALAHGSILVGCQLSGAHRLPFPHNNT